MERSRGYTMIAPWRKHARSTRRRTAYAISDDIDQMRMVTPLGEHGERVHHRRNEGLGEHWLPALRLSEAVAYPLLEW